MYRIYPMLQQRLTPTPNWLERLYAGEEPPTPPATSYQRYRTEQIHEAVFTNLQHTTAIDTVLNRNVPKEYETFFIPKRTGGMRRIDAPSEDLKKALRDIKDILSDRCGLHPHDAAYAYVQGRSIKQAIEVHQQNESKWFLKLDLKDFFPSHTTEILKTQLSKIYGHPAEPVLQRICEYATLEDKLPQGSPLSPLLTNLACVPLDYTLTSKLMPQYRYTRYADDMLISSRVKFNPETVANIVREAIREQAPYLTINEDKTRFGSSSGRNWNLGLMYNSEDRITIGHKKKERLRAGIQNFMFDFTNGRIWSTIDAQVLRGQLEFYKSIEPEQAEQIIQKYSTKFGVDYYDAYRRTLNHGNI